jgi:hypothetical protein
VKPRFRPWQLAAVLVLLCLIAIGVAMYLRRPLELSPHDMLSHMPRGESTIIYVDLRAIRDSGLLERMAGSAIGEEDEYKNFVASTGFDYKTDLDAMLVSSTGDTQLLLLRGRFDWKSILKYAQKQGGTCRTGFCRLPSSKPSRIISFYAVNPSTMALGVSTEQWAAAEIKPRPSEKLDIDAPPQPLWMAVPASTLKNPDKFPAGTKQFAKVLAGAEKVIFTMGSQQDHFEVAMDVTCKTQEEAAVLRAELEELTTLLQKLISREKQAPNPGDLSGVLVAGSFQRVDRHVVGKWPVQKAFMDNLTGGG